MKDVLQEFVGQHTKHKYKYDNVMYVCIVRYFYLISYVYDLEFYIFLIVYFPPGIFTIAPLSFRGLNSFPRKKNIFFRSGFI